MSSVVAVTLDDVPPDVLVEILSRVQVQDIGRVSRVCRAWNDLLHNDTFFWRALAMRELDSSSIAITSTAKLEQHTAEHEHEHEQQLLHHGEQHDHQSDADGSSSLSSVERVLRCETAEQMRARFVEEYTCRVYAFGLWRMVLRRGVVSLVNRTAWHGVVIVFDANQRRLFAQSMHRTATGVEHWELTVDGRVELLEGNPVPVPPLAEGAGSDKLAVETDARKAIELEDHTDAGITLCGVEFSVTAGDSGMTMKIPEPFRGATFKVQATSNGWIDAAWKEWSSTLWSRGKPSWPKSS